MELGHDPSTTAVSSRRRGLWVGLGLVAAAAVVSAVALVVIVDDDDTASVVPATEEPTVPSTDDAPDLDASISPSTSTPTSSPSASTTESSADSDPTMLAALAGHRWVLESASDGGYVADAGLIPWIEFGDDPFVRGSDGCNVFGADGSVDARGVLVFAGVESTTVDCSDEVPVVALAAATRVEVVDGGGQIDLIERLDRTPSAERSWRLRRLDTTNLPMSDALMGRWVVSRSAPGFVEFRPDGSAWVGECSATWALDTALLSTSRAAAPAACLGDGAVDATHAAVLDLLASGRATVAFEVVGSVDPITGSPSGVLLSTRDTLIRLLFAGRVTGDVLEVSPEADLPALVAVDQVAFALEHRESTAARSWSPRLELADDGSLAVLDIVASTVTAYEVDGSIRWTTAIPAEIDGAHPWDVAVGPDAILYLSYELASTDSTSFVLVAVPIEGTGAGRAVATWATPWQCVESFCGEVRLVGDGVLLDEFGAPDATVQAYVDAAGRPSGATYAAPAVATQELGHGPRLPADTAGSDELGNMIGSFRTTVTLDARSWTFDAVGARFAEGVYAFFDAQPDGSVASVFGVARAAGQPGTEVWLDLLPDGAAKAWRLPDDLGVVLSVARIGGERYAVAVGADGIHHRLVRLTPA